MPCHRCGSPIPLGEAVWLGTSTGPEAFCAACAPAQRTRLAELHRAGRPIVHIRRCGRGPVPAVGALIPNPYHPLAGGSPHLVVQHAVVQHYDPGDWCSDATGDADACGQVLILTCRQADVRELPADRFPDPPGFQIVADSGWREVCAACGAPGSATEHQHRCLVCGGAAWFIWAQEPFCPDHLPDLDRYLRP